MRYQINNGISEHTMGLISIKHIEHRTLILETNGSKYSKASPLQLIEHACLKYGSTYDGRRKAATYMTGIRLKTPIGINPARNIYAFPTHSPQKFECNWIFPQHVQRIRRNGKYSMITFTNDKDWEIEVSYFTLEKQLHRAAYCFTKSFSL